MNGQTFVAVSSATSSKSLNINSLVATGAQRGSPYNRFEPESCSLSENCRESCYFWHLIPASNESIKNIQENCFVLCKQFIETIVDILTHLKGGINQENCLLKNQQNHVTWQQVILVTYFQVFQFSAQNVLILNL